MCVGSGHAWEVHADGFCASIPVQTCVSGSSGLLVCRCIQATLTDEMVGLAAGLKHNTAAMEGAVRERGRLLDSAETMLDGNLHGTQRSVRESKAVRTRRARDVPAALPTLLICLR